MEDTNGNALKRSSDEVEDTSATHSPMDEDSSAKKPRVDPDEIDITTNGSDAVAATEKQDTSPSTVQEPKDVQTGLTDTQTAALERARQYARQVQEELFKAGTITTITDPEPSLAIANIVEQQKALHNLCRVYVGSISFEATEDEVRQRLNRFGAIKDLSLKVDPMTAKHRGFCFVEYELPEAAILAVEATDSIDIVGRTLRIGRPKNYDANAVNDLPPPPQNRIYVANIGSPVSESALSGIFAAFGEVETCILMPDPITRKHKGYGYVQFKSGTDVDTVVSSMKGFMLLDLPMGVCKAIVGGPLPEGMKALDSMPVTTAAPPSLLQARVHAPVSSVSPALIARAQATAASTAQRLVALQGNGANGERDSVASEENMSISGNQRYMVMQSLARSGGGAAGLFPQSSAGPAAAAAPKEAESTVVRLQYNATPADIDDQLEEEFSEECSKYGPVVRVQMLPLADGLLKIFIQFQSSIDARSAAAQLNGRQFDGKTIHASLFDQASFLAGRLG